MNGTCVISIDFLITVGAYATVGLLSGNPSWFCTIFNYLYTETAATSLFAISYVSQDISNLQIVLLLKCP